MTGGRRWIFRPYRKSRMSSDALFSRKSPRTLNTSEVKANVRKTPDCLEQSFFFLTFFNFISSYCTYIENCSGSKRKVLIVCFSFDLFRSKHFPLWWELKNGRFTVATPPLVWPTGTEAMPLTETDRVQRPRLPLTGTVRLRVCLAPYSEFYHLSASL